MFAKRLHPLTQTITAGHHATGKRISAWTKPTTGSRVVGSLQDPARPKAQLVAKNGLLRQQLVVLNCTAKRPHFTRSDRPLLVLLASRMQAGTDALLIVKPDTLVRWHREGFRLF